MGQLLKFSTENEDHSDAPNNGVKFDCHICDAKLASKGSLFNHVKHVHERQKKFKCDLCERYFAAKQQMQQHISSFHEGNKPFQCEICQDMRWATRGGLVEHMASVHEGKLKTYLNLKLNYREKVFYFALNFLP